MFEYAHQRKPARAARTTSPTRTPAQPVPAARVAHDFARVAIQPSGSEALAEPELGPAPHARLAGPPAGDATRPCPLPGGPRACPTGGACHECPARIRRQVRGEGMGASLAAEPASAGPGRVAASLGLDGVVPAPPRLAMGAASTTPVAAAPATALATSAPNAAPGPAAGGSVPGASPALRGYLERSQARGRPLDAPLRRALEASYGTLLEGVRVIADEDAARAADALDANAFTLGSSIWFARGAYQPETAPGRRLIAHEVAHAVQQGGAAPAIQADLRVGGAADPAELAADHAADAFMRGQSARPGAAGPAILRRNGRSCTASRTDDTSAQVTCGTERYRVTVTRTPEERPGTHVTATPDVDQSSVWVDVDICRGRTRGTVTPSLNVLDVANQVIDNVIAGRSATSGVSVSPSLRIGVTRSGGWSGSVTGRVDVDPRRGDVTGWRAEGEVQTPQGGTFGGWLEGDPHGVTGGGVTMGYRAPPEQFNCTRTEYRLDFSCERLDQPVAPPPEPEHEPSRPRTPSAPPPVDLYLFFEYEHADVLPRELPSAERLQQLQRDGYHAVSIEGFASPEGPHERRRGRFPGNKVLSDQRAQAARDWLQTNAAGLLTPSTTVGHGQEYELHGPATDIEGDPLTRYTVPRFLGDVPGTTADPRAPTDEAQRAALRAATPARQRDAVFPELRRAMVHLEAPAPPPARLDLRLPAATIERYTSGPATTCPPEVIRAARPLFTPRD